VFAGLFGVVCGVVEVAFRHVGMVRGLFTMAGFIVFRSGLVMKSSLPKDCDGSIDAQ
jgi:hypothetical protein